VAALGRFAVFFMGNSDHFVDICMILAQGCMPDGHYFVREVLYIMDVPVT
jgi:hypothetical protein